MLKRDKPSEYFCDAILRGYNAELKAGHIPTVSGIWNQIVMECIPHRGAFEAMFCWDTSRAKKGANRIRDIAETIERGYIPGMELAQDARDREVVMLA